jgi:hypothetical protein
MSCLRLLRLTELMYRITPYMLFTVCSADISCERNGNKTSKLFVLVQIVKRLKQNTGAKASMMNKEVE